MEDQEWIFRDKINQIFAEQMSTWAGKDFMIWRSWNNNVKQQQKTIYDWNQQKTTPYICQFLIFVTPPRYLGL